MIVLPIWASVHSFLKIKIKKDETDNYYTCVALRAAGKNAQRWFSKK